MSNMYALCFSREKDVAMTVRTNACLESHKHLIAVSQECRDSAKTW